MSEETSDGTIFKEPEDSGVTDRSATIETSAGTSVAENWLQRHTFPKGTILKPSITKEHIEVSAHRCPKTLVRELTRIFPDTDLTDTDDCPLLAVPTSQHTKMDLVQIGEDVEDEKDYRLERFAEMAERVCKVIFNTQPIPAS